MNDALVLHIHDFGSAAGPVKILFMINQNLKLSRFLISASKASKLPDNLNFHAAYGVAYCFSAISSTIQQPRPRLSQGCLKIFVPDILLVSDTWLPCWIAQETPL